jgi:hypothetical protein
MAEVDEVAGGTLGAINVGALALNTTLPALSAQIDALIALGLGPAKLDLAASLNATVAAQAELQVTIGDPLATLKAALAAVIQLQASLSASLSLGLPPIELSATAQLSASAALAVSLQARLGVIEGLIRAALAVTIPAIHLSDGLGSALGVGPAIVLAFDGISDGTNMAAIGALLQTKLAAPVTFGGDTINPGDPVSGVVIITKASPVFAALAQLIAGI